MIDFHQLFCFKQKTQINNTIKSLLGLTKYDFDINFHQDISCQTKFTACC